MEKLPSVTWKTLCLNPYNASMQCFASLQICTQIDVRLTLFGKVWSQCVHP